MCSSENSIVAEVGWVSDRSVVAWNATFTADEVVLFERIKRCCGSRRTFDNFMRCIRLFNESYITPRELIELAGVFLRRAPKVLDEFVKLIRFCEPDDETCGYNSQPRLAYLLNSVLKADGDAHAQIEQVMHDMDYGTERALSISYRCVAKPRSELAAESVLNETWMCFPSTNVYETEESASGEGVDERSGRAAEQSDPRSTPPPFSNPKEPSGPDMEHREPPTRGARYQSVLGSPSGSRYAILNVSNAAPAAGKPSTSVSPRAATLAYERVCVDCEEERCELEAAISYNRAAVQFLERVQRTLARAAGRPLSPKAKARSSSAQKREQLAEDAMDEADYSVADAVRDCDALRSRSGYAIQRRAIERAYDDCAQRILDELVTDVQAVADAGRRKLPRAAPAPSTFLKNRQLKVKTRLFNSFAKRPAGPASACGVGGPKVGRWKSLQAKAKVRGEKADVAANSASASQTAKSKAKAARRMLCVGGKRQPEASIGESNVVTVVLRRIRSKLSCLLSARSRFEPIWSARVRQAFERRRAALIDWRIRRDAARFGTVRIVQSLRLRRCVTLAFGERGADGALDPRKRRQSAAPASWNALFDDLGTLVQAALRSAAFANDTLRFAVDGDGDGDAVSARDRVEFLLKRIWPALFAVAEPHDAFAKRARALRSTRLCSRNLVAFFCNETESTDDDQPDVSHSDADASSEPQDSASPATNALTVNTDWFLAFSLHQSVCERLRSAQKRLCSLELERRDAKRKESSFRASLGSAKKRKLAEREPSGGAKATVTDALFAYRRFVETLRGTLMGSLTPEQFVSETRTLFSANELADDTEDDEEHKVDAAPFRFVHVLTLPGLVGSFVRSLLRLVHGDVNIGTTRALVSWLLTRAGASAASAEVDDEADRCVSLAILGSPFLRLQFTLRGEDADADAEPPEAAADSRSRGRLALRCACSADRFAHAPCEDVRGPFLRRNLRNSLRLWLQECTRFQADFSPPASHDHLAQVLLESSYFSRNLAVCEDLQYVHVPPSQPLSDSSGTVLYVPGTCSLLYRRGSLRRATALNPPLRERQLARIRCPKRANEPFLSLSSCFQAH